MSWKKLPNRMFSAFPDSLLPVIRFFVRDFLIFSIMLLSIENTVFSEERLNQGERNLHAELTISKVALVPLENLSRSPKDALPDIITLMSKSLVDKKKVLVVSPELVEDFLIKERIRNISSMSKATIRQMGKFLKVDGIIFTYVDLLVSGEDPEIGIGCRMVSGYDGSLIWTGYTALTGREFASWLGLGRITSLEKLAERAVEKLIISFLDKMNVSFGNTIPFEIAEISVNPKNVRSSDRIKVRVKLTSMGNIPAGINARLGGQERTLFDERSNIFDGTFYAPLSEGKYPLKIEVRDQEGGIFVFDSVAIIEVDNTSPRVIVYYQDKLFSPNRDKIKDSALFFPYLEEADTIKNWQFAIENREGEVIRQSEGKAELPRALVWRGEDDSYSAVGDGEYYFKFRTQDKAGNVAETVPRPIILDITPPSARITIAALKKKVFDSRLTVRIKTGSNGGN